MKPLATTARATLASVTGRKPTRATFADSLRIPSCYPKGRNDIHLH